MNANENEWFITERARALARMHLTRRDDLIVTQAGKDIGLDYVVYLTRKKEKPSLRQFGVLVRAARKPVTEEQLNRILRSSMQSSRNNAEFPYPVCLLYFTMQDNRGYSTWVVEPLLTEERKPRLYKHSTASCKLLDRPALDVIVQQVSAWYDVFFSSIVVSA